MIKYFAGRIEGYGELIAKMTLNQTYRGDYRLYRIVGIEKIYWLNGAIVPTSTFLGRHITGEVFDVSAYDTLVDAKAHMLQHLRQGQSDLLQAVQSVEYMIKQVSGVGE